MEQARIDPLLLAAITALASLLGAVIGGFMARSAAIETMEAQFTEQEKRGVRHVKHRVYHDVTSIRQMSKGLELVAQLDGDTAVLVHDEAAMIWDTSTRWREQVVYVEDEELQAAIINWYARVRLKIGWSRSVREDCAKDISDWGNITDDTREHLERLRQGIAFVAQQGEVLVRKLGMKVEPLIAGPLPGDGPPNEPEAG